MFSRVDMEALELTCSWSEIINERSTPRLFLLCTHRVGRSELEAGGVCCSQRVMGHLSHLFFPVKLKIQDVYYIINHPFLEGLFHFMGEQFLARKLCLPPK